MTPFTRPLLSRPILLFPLLALLLATLACGFGDDSPSPGANPTSIPPQPTRTQESLDAPTRTSQPTLPFGGSDDLLRQWASGGEADSQYSSFERSAMQAGGAPDTLTCGLQDTAWTSLEPDERADLTLFYFEQPVVPTEINIVQSYNPGQVVRVELLDPYGEYSEAVVYEAEPAVVAPCPYTLSIPVTGVDHLIMGVRITVDQSVLGVGYTAIDAVELVGRAEGGGGGYSSGGGGGGDEVWQNVYTLPIFPSAENVVYLDEKTVIYSVTSNPRPDVLDFILGDLEYLGWQTDVDENGACRDPNRCLSPASGLDYASPENQLWYFIHPGSDESFLTLVLSVDSGTVFISLSLR